ncbi:hypothetical protein GCM10022249_02150 [Enteractinococcus coprophilus]
MFSRDPNTSPEYAQTLEALYPVAYEMKFISRRDKSKWQWTMMIMAPEWKATEVFENAPPQAGAKNPPARLGDVRPINFAHSTPARDRRRRRKTLRASALADFSQIVHAGF